MNSKLLRDNGQGHIEAWELVKFFPDILALFSSRCHILYLFQSLKEPVHCFLEFMNCVLKCIDIIIFVGSKDRKQ
jgi:hypothetical protein